MSLGCFNVRGLAAIAGALLLMFATIGHTAADSAYAVKGSGGSSSARVLAQWNFLFTKETKTSVAYAAANSDVGIRDAIARSVDFACTEIPLSAEDLRKNDLIQFPLLVGGVVLVVNIPGVAPGALRLDSNLISKIYLGEIKFWNDSEIRGANPGLNLPELPIRLVVRETAASTTLALTTFLARTDRKWAARIGANKQPEWPAPTFKVATVLGMGEKVQSTPGAIGYINYDEAYRKKLVLVRLRNRAGQYVQPSHESIRVAANSAGLVRNDDQIPTLINADGGASWPIVEVTYVLLDRKPKDLERARSTLRFFFWSFLHGDEMAAETGFIPLPSSTQSRVVAHFHDVLMPDNRPLDFLR
jgi:phosphate transport system substrate-binding protein